MSQKIIIILLEVFVEGNLCQFVFNIVEPQIKEVQKFTAEIFGENKYTVTYSHGNTNTSPFVPALKQYPLDLHSLP
jgi:hypothetical protein